ncbi:MAG: IS30 family transposase [Microcystaceae cyanobacterium]
MSYSQLSASERHRLYQLRTTTDLSLRAIALELGRNQSTLSRELARNQTDGGIYLPDRAQQKMAQRRSQSKTTFSSISEECVAEIKARLQQYHSPEQIAGRLRREGSSLLSHETIYQMIYANHEGMADYQQYLRQRRGKRRKRGGSNSKRGQIPGRVGIEHRPAIADAKLEIGHWESDTMIGGNHSGVIVTHVDKASKFLVAGLGKNKTSAQVNQVTISLFSQVSDEQRHTMTFDNGKEFIGHGELSQALGICCYFANPYHSWERGLNEHTNGLLRQFFPKQTNFRIVKPEALAKAVTLINNRPRKSLDYKTPYEVFYAGKSDTDALQI